MPGQDEELRGAAHRAESLCRADESVCNRKSGPGRFLLVFFLPLFSLRPDVFSSIFHHPPLDGAGDLPPTVGAYLEDPVGGVGQPSVSLLYAKAMREDLDDVLQGEAVKEGCLTASPASP